MTDNEAMIWTAVLGVLTLFLLCATALSFAHISHGFVRSFAFPRLQVLVLAAVSAVLAFIFVPQDDWRNGLLFALFVVALVQAVSILQFTPLRKRQSQRYRGSPDDPNTVSVLSFNVKMSNRDHAKAVALTGEANPDIAVFMETDQRWADGLAELGTMRPHVVSAVHDNSYGMILFSRLPLRETKVEYLVMEGVPSIVTTVILPDGQKFRLHCIHPEPPVPYAGSEGRDAELIRVAEAVEADPLPAIVCGDLNDVAWSHTTRLFQRLSGLLDPRVGRGFYNTFDARYWFMRWPLDHLFHDARFELIDMKRLQNAGSDHFPIYFKLALTGSSEGADRPEKADRQDQEEATSLKKEAMELDREAIGTDWEK